MKALEKIPYFLLGTLGLLSIVGAIVVFAFIIYDLFLGLFLAFVLILLLATLASLALISRFLLESLPEKESLRQRVATIISS